MDGQLAAHRLTGSTESSEMPTEPVRRRLPVILSVDDDRQVLDAILTDLRSAYGGRYRIIGASSGDEALQIVRRLRLRNDDLGLVVADQRMPVMSGTTFLAAAKDVYPTLKSVLLTAYADTDAAITAINEVNLDYYVTKPWDPPEERLFPVLDDLLEEWQATRPPPETGLRLVGDRWSAASHRLRDYLARNQLPFRWVDVDDHDAAAALMAAAPDGARLPLVVLEDGRTLADPSLTEVAEALGVAAHLQVDFFDLVIVGAGPAGLAAAVYGGSEGLSTIVVEAEAPGGQAGLSSRIENYLGFPSGVSGAELTRRAFTQMRRFGSSVLSPRFAVRIHRRDPYRVVLLDDGTELHCAAVILAMGVQYARLEGEGVERLTGAGIYYGGVSTETADITGQRVIVVGGANSAGQAALYLARFASDVIMLLRGDSLASRMSRYLVDRIEGTGNISVRTGTAIDAALGDAHLGAVRVTGPDGTEELPAAGMFVFVGAKPRTDWLEGDVVRDELGFVVTGPALRPDRWSLERDPFLLETSLPGVFAVGDVRSRSVKRIASAVGEGSIAVQFVHEVLRGG